MNYLLTGKSSERLTFRLLTRDDFNDWVPLFASKETAVFLGMDIHLSPEECCEFWFTKSLGRYEKQTGGMNVLVDKQTGKMVGQCGLIIQDIEGEKLMEIGYAILPEHWGKGYASEAAMFCKHYAFEHNFTDAIISMIHVDNIGSETVARKNGMSQHKYLPSYQGQPMNMFRITKEEYLQQG